ncbi:SpoIID/LytB domain-containing protein [Leptolyngbya ohadii]|uniref:SpoIID/LytB domain-containing protein n=1 Tax=Leptolyngbya ohadii TaxID=1962290 RepID=UPI000B5A03DB|nr:SpoIID/LytB domain-containing protein [Leptolyngbya ohadii]
MINTQPAAEAAIDQAVQSPAEGTAETSIGLRWLRWIGHYGKKSGWMTLLFWLLAIAPALANLELRVAIEQDVSQVKVGSSTDAVLRDSSGKVLAQIPGMNAVMAQSEDGQIAINEVETTQLWVEPKSADGYVFIGDKWYRGRTLVTPTAGGLTAVNYVDLEQYLYSVVGAEMPANWDIQALKAQAVAARSYVLYQRQNSANAVFDVGDTTRWQVYNGLEAEAASTRAAVDATKGQVLTYQGQIINAVFHSCAGGHTENVEDIWTNPLPYLRGVPSPDQDMQGCKWNPRTVSAQEVAQAIGYQGTITAIVPNRHQHGRVLSLQINGTAGDVTIDADEFRAKMDLRSTLFSIDPVLGRVASAGDNVPSVPVSFQISGSGFGHGVGMSQYGAYALALRGWNYQQIVSHYYKDVQLQRIEVR